MPLIEVHALRQPVSVDVEAVTAELNRAVAAAIPCRLEAVWTVWRTLDGPYLVGDAGAVEQPSSSHAPIVHVYLRRTPEQTARAVEAIERALTSGLALAEGNVFVTVQPVAWPDEPDEQEARPATEDA